MCYEILVVDLALIFILVYHQTETLHNHCIFSFSDTKVTTTVVINHPFASAEMFV